MGRAIRWRGGAKWVRGSAKLLRGAAKRLRGRAKLLRGGPKLLRGTAKLLKGTAKLLRGTPIRFAGDAKLLRGTTKRIVGADGAVRHAVAGTGSSVSARTTRPAIEAPPSPGSPTMGRHDVPYLPRSAPHPP